MLSALNTLFTGQMLMRLEAVSSTNDYLRDLVRATNTAEGAVVVANSQQAGRGQRGTNWHSERGKNLIMSVLYRPTFLSTDQQFYLSKAVALAVSAVVRKFTKANVQVKWPNDVLVNGKKVCGILIENLHSGADDWQSVIGIGLNVNQSEFAPALPNATSLSQVTGAEIGLNVVLYALCEALEAHYLQLRKSVTALDERYLQELYAMNEWRTFEASGQEFSGCIRGVNAAGKLLVEQASGKLHAFELKEVKLLA